MLTRLGRTSSLVMALALMGASAPPTERLIAGAGLVDVSLAGEPARLRVDPAAPGMILMSKAFAQNRELRMSKRLGIGFVYAIGSDRVTSSTAVTKVDLGGGVEKRRVGWSARPFSPVADGSIGPAGLPDPIVRFQLQRSQAGEWTIRLPMTRFGFAEFVFGGGWQPSSAEIEIDGAPMRIIFDPHHARSLATAGAAVRLSRAYGGATSGEAVPTEIFFGVKRPVRTLTLARPMQIGALSITTLGVRTSDFGNAGLIPEAGVVPPPADPNEIVVTAKGKKRDTSHDVISLGADLLGRCSSIVFDKPAKQIALTCTA